MSFQDKMNSNGAPIITAANPKPESKPKPITKKIMFT